MLSKSPCVVVRMDRDQETEKMGIDTLAIIIIIIVEPSDRHNNAQCVV